VGRTVLFLGAHPDDIEFGAAGTLARLKRLGHVCDVAVFSRCEKSLPSKYPRDQLVSEMGASMKVLGVDQSAVLDFPVREFPAFRQAILEELFKICSARKYSMVFAPSSADIHQDHSTLSNEVTRAFQDTRILHYEIARNRPDFFPVAYIEITREDLRAKLDAVQCYKSQIELRPHVSDPRILEGLARVRGMQIKAEFAEAFEVSRYVFREGDQII
jgi:LmbE family N-acetylglucosaminyl deacetylase